MTAPDDLRLVIQARLAADLDELDPNALQRTVAEDVASLAGDTLAGYGRGAGKTTALLFACLALLQEDEQTVPAEVPQ